MTCGTCIAAAELRTLATTGRRAPTISVDYDAAQEALDEAGLRATIAAEFGVEPWDVTVHPGAGGVTATVFLNTAAVTRYR